MSKAWRESHREKAREVARRASMKYRLANLETAREKERARSRASHLKYPTANRERKRRQRVLHGAEIYAKRRAVEALNPEESREKARRWYMKGIEKKRARERAWQKAHPIAFKIKAAKYRARKAGNGGAHTAAEWLALCWGSHWRCAYCGAGPLADRRATQDHKIPIARGGSDDIENIAVSCGFCNSRKGILTDIEFLARLAREARG